MFTADKQSKLKLTDIFKKYATKSELAMMLLGMLAAIGVIIFSKQSYVMMGLMPESSKPFEQILQLPAAILQLNPVFFCLGLLAFAIVVVWPHIKRLAFIPSSLIILILVNYSN